MKKIIILLLAISLGFNFYQQRQITQQEEQINSLNEDLAKANEKPPLHPIEAETKECINNCGGFFSIICMSECVDKATNKWDEEAMKTVLKLQKVLSKEDYQTLLTSEKSWKTYKELQIKLINKNIGSKQGLIHLNFASSDIEMLSKDHAKSLKNLLHDIENN